MGAALSVAGAGQRTRLTQLDDCLTLLEDAHERDEQIVSTALASRLGSTTRSVAPGMLITEALELVFQEQEEFLAPEIDPAADPVALPRRDAPRLLLTGNAAGPPGGAAAAAPLDAASARRLTDRIKASANMVSLLLLEAHEGRAWPALGYRTWERYVHAELGLSRARSYELLDHGRLIRCIRDITGTTAVPDVPPYAARRVKPQLAEFVADLRRRVAGRPIEDVPAVLDQVLRDHRRPEVALVRTPEPRDASASAPEAVAEAVRVMRSAAYRGWPEHLDAALLCAVIDCLAAMPPPASVIDRVWAETGEGLSGLDDAIGWLTSFAGAWRARHRPRHAVHRPRERAG